MSLVGRKLTVSCYMAVRCQGFELKIIKAQNTQDLLSKCLKEFTQSKFQNRAISRRYLSREYGLGVEGRTEPRDQSPLCVPLHLQGPANISLPNICLTISRSVAFPPLLKSQTTNPNILFCL